MNTGGEWQVHSGGNETTKSADKLAPLSGIRAGKWDGSLRATLGYKGRFCLLSQQHVATSSARNLLVVQFQGAVGLDLWNPERFYLNPEPCPSCII